LSSNSTQISAATTLVQLLTENPELPRLRWTINPDGWFCGSLYEDHVDARTAMAQFAAVLGGEPNGFRRPSEDGESGSERFSTVLTVTWRDVRVHLAMGCDAAFVTELAQVAA
jgi:hypothetical protein